MCDFQKDECPSCHKPWIKGQTKVDGKDLDICLNCYLEFKNTCTCNVCRDAPICKYAYDYYNTNGDCLAEK